MNVITHGSQAIMHAKRFACSIYYNTQTPENLFKSNERVLYLKPNPFIFAKICYG
jgi:hypothetical protein